jgi:hypothetical protein
VRVENRDAHLVALHCTFVETSAEVPTRIRARVASSPAAARRQGGRRDS